MPSCSPKNSSPSIATCRSPLDLHAMETQPPDLEACRTLFTELEFTSMLRDLAPAEGGASVELIDEPTAEQAAAFYTAARAHGFAFALDAAEPACRGIRRRANQPLRRCSMSLKPRKRRRTSALASAPIPARALRLPLTPELRALLEDASVPKRVHDWKLALHVLGEMGVALRGPVDDTMLLSYALNPTHATQALADVAARHGQPPPTSLPAAAAAIHALVPALREEAEQAGVARVYTEIDLPLGARALSHGEGRRAHRHNCIERAFGAGSAVS